MPIKEFYLDRVLSGLELSHDEVRCDYHTVNPVIVVCIYFSLFARHHFAQAEDTDEFVWYMYYYFKWIFLW